MISKKTGKTDSRTREYDDDDDIPSIDSSTVKCHAHVTVIIILYSFRARVRHVVRLIRTLSRRTFLSNKTNNTSAGEKGRRARVCPRALCEPGGVVNPVPETSFSICVCVCVCVHTFSVTCSRFDETISHCVRAEHNKFIRRRRRRRRRNKPSTGFII